MTNKTLYDNVFMETLEIGAQQLSGLNYQDVPTWDSVGHMALMAALEEAFDIMMETDDIIDFNSYEKGMEILSGNYEIKF